MGKMKDVIIEAAENLAEIGEHDVDYWLDHIPAVPVPTSYWVELNKSFERRRKCTK